MSTKSPCGNLAAYCGAFPVQKHREAFCGLGRSRSEAAPALLSDFLQIALPLARLIDARPSFPAAVARRGPSGRRVIYRPRR
jgi:hypothetical protein